MIYTIKSTIENNRSKKLTAKKIAYWHLTALCLYGIPACIGAASTATTLTRNDTTKNAESFKKLNQKIVDGLLTQRNALEQELTTLKKDADAIDTYLEKIQEYKTRYIQFQDSINGLSDQINNIIQSNNTKLENVLKQIAEGQKSALSAEQKAYDAAVAKITPIQNHVNELQNWLNNYNALPDGDKLIQAVPAGEKEVELAAENVALKEATAALKNAKSSLNRLKQGVTENLNTLISDQNSIKTTLAKFECIKEKIATFTNQDNTLSSVIDNCYSLLETLKATVNLQITNLTEVIQDLANAEDAFKK